MKKSKNIYIILIFIVIALYSNICYCLGEMNIIYDKSIAQVGDEIGVKIEIKDIEIAATALEIYYDRAKLEYINGPENSNNIGNRIIYTWISDNGKNSNYINIQKFKFKALQDGIANIAVSGEFYNSNGEKIEIDDSNLEIKIGSLRQDTEEIITEQNESISANNTNLSILRLSEEGISPDFNKDIKEYYFIANENINNLDITAIPENRDANVIITGNKNLKTGENTIDIRVDSADKSKTSIYKIYLTKTDNPKYANANLETLAIRQGTLEPEFNNNMTEYKVEIGNDIDKIDILAISERENATVKILGNNEMKVGDNKIEIIVLAENGTTIKKYIVNVHRRNQEEELKSQEDLKYQAERLSTIVEEKKNEQNLIKEGPNKKIKNIIIIVTGVMLAMIICSIIYFYKFKDN